MAGDRGIKKYFWILFFILPSLLGLLIFTILPMLASLGLTLFDWDLLTPPKFVGLANFKQLFADPIFWKSLTNTLYFIACYIPVVIILGLLVALLLNQNIKGRSFLRASFFTPVISSWVAISLLWTWIFSPKYGIMNYVLGLFSITGPNWLYDTHWAMPAIIITSVWKDIGYIMIMYLAGLQNVSDEYYEAAELDGANSWQKFIHITFPMLSPITFFALIISLINSFQIFDQVWIMTQGGPANSTTTLVLQIVMNATRYGRYGYAAAISWVLFMLIFGFTVLQNQLQKKWVFYE